MTALSAKDVTDTPVTTRPRRDGVLVLVLLAVCLGVGFWHLGSKSLWFDETVSASYAHMSFGGLWRVVTGPDPNMSLYYGLLWVWGHIFGDGAFALRSLTVLLGCLAVPLMFGVGARLFDRSAGLVAGLLIAVSPSFVVYEQTIRSYGLVVVLTLLSTFCFLRARERPTSARLAAYVAASVLAIYAHYLVVAILFVHALVVVEDKRRDSRDVRRWLVAGAVMVLAFVPEAIVASGHSQNTAWIPVPALSELIKYPEFLSGSNLPVGSDYRVGHVATALLVILCVYQVVTGLRTRPAWPTGFVLAWLVVPVVLIFVESHIAQPFWQNEYMLGTLPAFLLLAAAGVVRLPRRALAAAMVAVLVGLQVVQLHHLADARQLEDWQGAARYMFTHARTGDEVVYLPADSKFGIAYYGREDGHPLLEQTTLAKLNASDSGQRRIWLVVKTDSSAIAGESSRISSALGARYVRSWQHEYAGAPRLELYRASR